MTRGQFEYIQTRKDMEQECSLVEKYYLHQWVDTFFGFRCGHLKGQEKYLQHFFIWIKVKPA